MREYIIHYKKINTDDLLECTVLATTMQKAISTFILDNFDCSILSVEGPHDVC